MKTLISIAALFLSLSAAAQTQEISCSNNSNSDEMLNIRVDADSRILGASLYNIDWSQTPEATYQNASAVGTINPMRGYRVYLMDGQTLDIDYSVLEAGHNGIVTLNSSDDYHCY